MVNCSSTWIWPRVVTVQPSAHRAGIAAAHAQRRRVLPRKSQGLRGTEDDSRQGTHQGQVGQRGAVVDDPGADEEPDPHAHTGRRDPPARVEATTAGQCLTGTEDEPGDCAADQRSGGAVDAADRRGAGQAGDGEGQEASGPQQPRAGESGLRCPDRVMGASAWALPLTIR